MERHKPGIDKALQWLSLLLRESRLKAGDSLPPVRQLAQECRVSTVSMSKAIQHLKREGVITGGPRRRSAVAADGNVPSFGPEIPGEPGRGLTPVSAVESELYRQILLGEIGPGTPFPSAKELRHHFHASQQTVRSALHRLYRKGLVQTENRWFCVRAPKRAKPNARIALVGFATAPHEPIIRAYHDTYLCSLLHAQVWQRNLLLDQASCPPGPSPVLYGPERGRPYAFDDNVIGCILLLNQLSDLWPSLCNRLADLHIPLAIIDEFGYWNVREYFPSPGRTRIFSFSTGRLAATEITRTLLRYGHRRFAYISPYSNTFWSGMRRDAVREELDKAGLGKNLTLFESNLHQEVSRLFPGGSGEEIHRYTTEALRHFPKVVQGAYARGNNYGTWSMNIGNEAVEILLQDRLKPLCDRSDITAWIAVNDACAIIASRMLHASGRRLPADVSLVSFDNSPSSQDLRISSYDFNAPGCVSAVLNFLTSSADSRRTFPAERVEIPGALVERASLGPAPGASPRAR